MKLYFLSTDVGCFEFLFTTDDTRATQLFAIYVALAKLRPSKLWFTEITVDAVIPPHRDDLKHALSWGSEGFASYGTGARRDSAQYFRWSSVGKDARHNPAATGPEQLQAPLRA
jgi:hypothetical protein